MDLQHTLNRVESTPYSVYKVYYRLEKEETFAHTQKKETQNFFFFASFEEYKALFSTERPFLGVDVEDSKRREREREAFNTKTLSLSSFSSLSFSLSLSLVLSRKTER